MQREKKTRPSRQARERVLIKELVNDTTLQRAVLFGLSAPIVPLLLLLILGPVVLP